MLKKPKRDVIADAHAAAFSALIRAGGYSDTPTPGQVQIADSIKAAIEVLVDNIYSDEEFETDIGISE